MRSRRLFALAALAIASILPLSAALAGDDDLALALRTNVVAISAEFQSQTQKGFGFVVGEVDGTLYIVTANHVVRSPASSDRPAQPARNLTVQFYESTADPVAARLRGESLPPPRDLAILEVQKPVGFRWEKASVAPDGSAVRGTEAWLIGILGTWRVPPTAGRIESDEPNIDGIFEIELGAVRVGSSGAPLVSRQGIVGMVVRDSSATVKALDVRTIRKAIADWHLPWSASSASVATGRLCVTTRGVPASAVVELDARATTIPASEGGCIDVAPGTYTLSVRAPGRSCDSFSVEVSAGAPVSRRLECQTATATVCPQIAGSQHAAKIRIRGDDTDLLVDSHECAEVPPGRYRFSEADGTGGCESLTVDLAAGTRRVLELDCLAQLEENTGSVTFMISEITLGEIGGDIELTVAGESASISNLPNKQHADEVSDVPFGTHVVQIHLTPYTFMGFQPIRQPPVRCSGSIDVAAESQTFGVVFLVNAFGAQCSLVPL
jgi:hypothetical protein